MWSRPWTNGPIPGCKCAHTFTGPQPYNMLHPNLHMFFHTYIFYNYLQLHLCQSVANILMYLNIQIFSIQIFVSSDRSSYSDSVLLYDQQQQRRPLFALAALCPSVPLHYAEVEKLGSKWSTLNNYLSTNFEPKWAKFSMMMYKYPNIWQSNQFSKFLG